MYYCKQLLKKLLRERAVCTMHTTLSFIHLGSSFLSGCIFLLVSHMLLFMEYILISDAFLRFSKMIERNACSLENLNSATDKFDKQSVESDRMIHMHPKYSNPAALGLSGHAIASFYFQLYSLEIVGPHLTVWLAIILGGFIQLLAGNSFAYACFGTFGGIWICFGLLLFHSNNSEVDAIRMDIAHFIAKENAVYLEYLSAGFSMSACLIALYIVGHLIFLGSENEKFWPLRRTFYEIMKQ
ncbi:Ammonia transport outward protein 2 [Trichinella britovi]|uniref:Ammonia transport outward protein 2 n=1 Tax=Trichinella britovi TaxID=45882 RepID=A0A0V1CZN9_TRIBR|nr:Ammonia transport outward protein 2 [Trichinella britovi]